MNSTLTKFAIHKKKIAVGTLVALLYAGYPHFLRVYHWYEKQAETREIAKKNEKAIEELKKCERKESMKLAEFEILIREINKRQDDRLNKLEYRMP